jgi:hypothetical protein
MPRRVLSVTQEAQQFERKAQDLVGQREWSSAIDAYRAALVATEQAIDASLECMSPARRLPASLLE